MTMTINTTLSANILKGREMVSARSDKENLGFRSAQTTRIRMTRAKPPDVCDGQLMVAVIQKILVARVDTSNALHFSPLRVTSHLLLQSEADLKSSSTVRSSLAILHVYVYKGQYHQQIFLNYR